MSKSPLKPTQQFEKAAPLPEHPQIDAANWETTHDHDEFNLDPPRRTHDPERAMAPTPFGTIDVEIQRQLDPAAQRAIHDAQTHEHQDSLGHPQEHEATDDRGADVQLQDDYERRLLDRFRHAHEHEFPDEPVPEL